MKSIHVETGQLERVGTRIELSFSLPFDHPTVKTLRKAWGEHEVIGVQVAGEVVAMMVVSITHRAVEHGDLVSDFVLFERGPAPAPARASARETEPEPQCP